MFVQVPSHLDAIIIGSGIGGMTTGAIMAKAGRRVLVLEQHDQAGGCCHSFLDKGLERLEAADADIDLMYCRL